MASLCKHLLLFRMLIAATALPTLGHVDREYLETYEDFSDETNRTDFLANLTFRFSCENRPVGLYADPDYDCRIFHVCDDSGTGFPVICANRTTFNQRERICTDEENVDCVHAHEWFYLNELPYSTDATEGNGLRSMEREQVPSVLPLIPLE